MNLLWNVHAAEEAYEWSVRAVAVVHRHVVVEAAVVVLHLERLEDERHLVVLGRCQPPHALLVGQVVVGEVGGLQVAGAVDEHVAATDGLVDGCEAEVAGLLGRCDVRDEQPTARRRDDVRRFLPAEST